jgi:hypothetical protein
MVFKFEYFWVKNTYGKVFLLIFLHLYHFLNIAGLQLWLLYLILI